MATRSWSSCDGPFKWRWSLCRLLALSAAHAVAHAQTADVVVTNFELWSNVDDNGIVRIIPIGAGVVNPAGCADPDSYMTRATMSASVQARVLAAALAAKTSGRTLTLKVSGCSHNRPAIFAVVVN